LEKRDIGMCWVKRGFTLIELLVVMAVLGVLAGILYPVLAKARARAAASSCQSNLRQLASAFQSYLQDWDERFPNSWRRERSPFGVLNHSWWDVLLSPYVRSDSVFSCPANDTESYSVHQPFNQNGVKTRRVNYAINNQLLGAEPGTEPFNYAAVEPPEPALLYDVEDAATTILLAEKMRDYPNNPPNPPDRPGNQSQEVDVWFHLTEPGITPPDWDTSWGVARALHNLGSNYAFVDGHVKYLRLQDTFTGGKVPETARAGAAPPGAATAPPPRLGATEGPQVSVSGAESEFYKDMWLLRPRKRTLTEPTP
jgi:prepilin-type N-terminal cleavage/methylation domain-containing protein/prepilin-type processing-associated H-X9-DG protein